MGPIMEELRERAIGLWQDEQYLLATWTQSMEDSQKDALIEVLYIYIYMSVLRISCSNLAYLCA